MSYNTSENINELHCDDESQDITFTSCENYPKRYRLKDIDGQNRFLEVEYYQPPVNLYGFYIGNLATDIRGDMLLEHPKSIDNSDKDLLDKLRKVFNYNNILTIPEELEEINYSKRVKKFINDSVSNDITIFKEMVDGKKIYHELREGKPYRITYDKKGLKSSEKVLLDVQIMDVTVIEPINDKISTSRYDLTVNIRDKEVVFRAKTQNELLKELQEKYSVNINGQPKNVIVSLCELIHTQAEHQQKVIKAMGKPGIYWYDNQVQIEGYSVPDIGNLKDALITLDIVVSNSYSKNQRIFNDIILWSIAAFTSYARKQNHIKPHVPHMIIHGPRDTGKSEDIEISMHFYVEDPLIYQRSGNGFSTAARRRAAVGEGTFPAQIEEISYKDVYGLEDDLKESYNEIFLKTQNNDQTTIYSPCLSSVYLSTNMLPSFSDEAFGKRVVILEIGHEHQIPRRTQIKYQKIKDDLQKGGKIEGLQEIGNYIADKIKKHPELLQQPWNEMGYNILTSAYSDLEIESPKWLQPMNESLNIQNSIETIREQGEEQTILILGQVLKKKSYDLRKYINMENHHEAQIEIKKIASDQSTNWLYVKNNGNLCIRVISLEKEINQDSGSVLPRGSIHNILQTVSENKAHRVLGLGKVIKGYEVTAEELYDILYKTPEI